MEMVVNRKLRKVTNVQIVYSKTKGFDKYLYFIDVECELDYYRYEWQIIEAFKNPEDAVKRAEGIQAAIDAEKKSLAESEVCHG